MERRSHNHGLDPSCNEHPTGDCIIQELRDRLENAESAWTNWQNVGLGMQTRAEAAEKAVARVEAYRDRLEAQDEQARFYAKGIQKSLDGVPNA